MSPGGGPERPTLSPDQVALLKPYVDGIGDPSQVAYGTPLAQIVEDGWGRDWLAAAVVAGHLPYSDALQLAFRGHFLWVRDEVADFAQRGVTGDALMWSRGEARHYREVATMLHAEADRLDVLSGEIEDSFARSRSRGATPWTVTDQEAAEQKDLATTAEMDVLWQITTPLQGLLRSVALVDGALDVPTAVARIAQQLEEQLASRPELIEVRRPSGRWWWACLGSGGWPREHRDREQS